MISIYVQDVTRYAMPLISVRLPGHIEIGLAKEAEATNRSKSEVARDAIVEYVARRERERFLAEIARAARARGDEEALEIADEALPTDNEALAIAEGLVAAKPKAGYRSKRRKR